VADDYVSKKDYGKAIELYTVVLENPKEHIDVDTLRKRGDAYFTLENYRLALNDYLLLVNLLPDDMKSLKKAGDAYLRLRDYHNAIDGFTVVLTNNSDDTESYICAGPLHMRV
jgi:tetratricopeptide (TPR) repeat protein